MRAPPSDLTTHTRDQDSARQRKTMRWRTVLLRRRLGVDPAVHVVAQRVRQVEDLRGGCAAGGDGRAVQLQILGKVLEVGRERSHVASPLSKEHFAGARVELPCLCARMTSPRAPVGGSFGAGSDHQQRRDFVQDRNERYAALLDVALRGADDVVAQRRQQDLHGVFAQLLELCQRQPRRGSPARGGV